MYEMLQDLCVHEHGAILDWIGLVYLTSNNKQAVLPYYMRSTKDKQAHKCKEKIKKKKKENRKKE